MVPEDYEVIVIGGGAVGLAATCKRRHLHARGQDPEMLALFLDSRY
jgi:cation diffusion facilitator CzcD-associated flavoprotein CzcO